MSFSAGGDKNHAFSVPAVADVQGARFVRYDGQCAIADADVVGITEAAARVGETLSITTYFSAPVEAAATIAKGDKVGVADDGTGRAVPGGGVGIAVTSGVAGTRVEVALVRSVGSGGGVDSSLTEAGILAASVAGTLKPLSWAAASDSKVPFWCPSASLAWPLELGVHLGTLPLATILAYPSPAYGMTARANDLDIITGAPVDLVHNGTKWLASHDLHMRKSGNGSAATGAQYPLNTRFNLPAGAFSLFSGGIITLKFNKSIGADTLNSWRIKLGSLGAAGDATIIAPPAGTPMDATIGHRVYLLPFAIESASSIKQDGVTGIQNLGINVTSQTTADVAAVSLNAGDDTSDALHLGVDYTMNTAGTPLTTVVDVVLRR